MKFSNILILFFKACMLQCLPFPLFYSLLILPQICANQDLLQTWANLYTNCLLKKKKNFLSNVQFLFGMRYNFRFIVDRLNGFHFFTIISIFLKNVWEWWRISQNIHWFLTSFFGPFTVYTSTSWRESKCKMVFLFVKICNNLVMWYLTVMLLLPHISMLWRWIWILITHFLQANGL